jgi:hypothetical protein
VVANVARTLADAFWFSAMRYCLRVDRFLSRRQHHVSVRRTCPRVALRTQVTAGPQSFFAFDNSGSQVRDAEPMATVAIRSPQKTYWEVSNKSNKIAAKTVMLSRFQLLVAPGNSPSGGPEHA